MSEFPLKPSTECKEYNSFDIMMSGPLAAGLTKLYIEGQLVLCCPLYIWIMISAGDQFLHTAPLIVSQEATLNNILCSCLKIQNRVLIQQ